MMESLLTTCSNRQESPFDLTDDRTYQRWREWKLRDYPRTAGDLIVRIADPFQISALEKQALLQCCRKTNAAIYQISDGNISDKELVSALGHQFGLKRLDRNLRADEDSITSLQVMPDEDRTLYIPYTNRALNWHTDGYYNTSEEQVKGVVLHCVSDAAEGGDNVYLDHEIAYILLRDENPDYISALMQPDAMTIPGNTEAGLELRPAQTGPVFSVEIGTGNLHMRYSARLRNIHWKDDPDTQAAVSFLQDLWANGCPYMYHYRLVPGQGVICNNVLHSRTAFEDSAAAGQRRLLYRARYYDRVSGTDLGEFFTP